MKSKRLTVLLQDAGGQRKPQKAELIMDEDTKAVLDEIIAGAAGKAAGEAAVATVERAFAMIGMDPLKHSQDHQRFDKIEQWVTAAMHKEEALTLKANAQRAFLEDTWKMGFFKPGLIFVGWLLIAAVIFGLSRAIQFVLPLLSMPA